MISDQQLRFNQLITTALFVRRELHGRNYMMNAAKSGGSDTIYVFDSDIIKTRCAPWVTGPRSGTANGYGVIFDEPTSENGQNEISEKGNRKAEKIALALATFALNLAKESKRNAIFQLPSHAAETNRVYRAVRRSFERFASVDRNSFIHRRAFDLSRTIAVLRHQVDQGLKLQQALPQLDRIIELLIYHSSTETPRSRAIREWDKYFELETEYGGLYSLSDAKYFFPANVRLAHAFDATKDHMRTADEQKTRKVLIDHWETSLRKPQSGKVSDDAAALADLFLVNSRLKSTNTRCVLITGDKALTTSAYPGIPPRLVASEDVELATGFSLQCVRHLWAFLSDALIDPSNQDLFSGLLARWTGDRHIAWTRVEDVLTRKSEGPIDMPSIADVEDVLHQWDQLTFKSVGKIGLEELNSIEQMRNAIWARVTASQSDDFDWPSLIPRLQEDIDRVRDRTVLAMSDLGIESIISATKIGKRNPPDLIFDSLTATNSTFQRLSSVKGYSSVDDFATDFAKIRDDCYDSSRDGDDRQESHLKFLVLGAAFASANKWMIALSHALRAIAIIERSRSGSIPVRHTGEAGGPKSHMSGREAYFLAASAQRVIATDMWELEIAQRYLHRSREALRKDREKGTAANITELRFRNEELALRLSKYYLMRYQDETDLQDALAEAVYLSAEPLAEELSLWNSPRGANSPNFLTAVGIATNLLQTYVISRFRLGQMARETITCPVTLSHVSKATLLIDELSTWKNEDRSQDEGVVATRLIKSYASAGEYLSGAASRKNTLKELDSLHRDPTISNVTIYDSWRFAALRKLIGHL